MALYFHGENRWAEMSHEKTQPQTSDEREKSDKYGAGAGAAALAASMLLLWVVVRHPRLLDGRRDKTPDRHPYTEPRPVERSVNDECGETPKFETVT